MKIITLPTLGFEPMTLQSQGPNLLSRPGYLCHAVSHLPSPGLPERLNEEQASGAACPGFIARWEMQL